MTNKQTYSCNKCDKTYVLKHAYDKHMSICCNTSDTDIVMIQKSNKKNTIPKALKITVWNKYIGEDIGKAKCYCCEITDITQLKFHCGHIIAEANNGESHIDNLRPICESCNKSMATKNMDDFKQQLTSNKHDNIDNKLNIIIAKYNEIHGEIVQKRMRCKSALDLIDMKFDPSNNICLDTNRCFLDRYIHNNIKIEPYKYKQISYMDQNMFIDSIYQLYSHNI